MDPSLARGVPPGATPEKPSRTSERLLASPVTAVVAIWLSAVLCSVFAPDMVTGSEHEHLPMAAFTTWIWAAVASGYVLMGARGQRAGSGLVVGTMAIWLLVFVATVFAPTMVTGTDPTTIPISVFIAPVAGAVTTGFLALHHVSR